MSNKSFLNSAVGSKLTLIHYSKIITIIMSKAWIKWQIHKAKKDQVAGFWSQKTWQYTREQAVSPTYTQLFGLWIFLKDLFRNIKENRIPPLSQFGLVLIALDPVDPAKTSCNITITFRFCQIKSVEYAITSNLK